MAALSLPAHSVNALFLGAIVPFSKAGSLQMYSAMNKQGVPTLTIKTSTVAGDEHAEPLPIHGGPERVVHHIPVESYGVLSEKLAGESWASELARAGGLGENVSTTGLTARDVCIGDAIRAGSALLEVAQPRMPCYKINHRFKHSRASTIVENERLTGWFYRVLEEGTYSGEPLVLERRPYPTLVVHDVYGILSSDDVPLSLVQAAHDCDQLSSEWRFVAGLRLKNGNVIPASSGRRLVGGDLALDAADREQWKKQMAAAKAKAAKEEANKLAAQQRKQLLLWIAAVIAVVAVVARVLLR